MTNARLEELRTRFQENPRRYFAPFANELRKSGDAAQAIAVCRTHLAAQPGHVSGHIVLGQALYEAGESAEARDVFTAALELDPENLIALRSLGEIAQVSGDFPTARQWYERLLDADPRNGEVAQLLKDMPVAAASAPAPPVPLDDAPALPDGASAALLEPVPAPTFHTSFTGSGPAYQSDGPDEHVTDEPAAESAATQAPVPEMVVDGLVSRPAEDGPAEIPADELDFVDGNLSSSGALPDTSAAADDAAASPESVPDESLDGEFRVDLAEAAAISEWAPALSVPGAVPEEEFRVEITEAEIDDQPAAAVSSREDEATEPESIEETPESPRAVFAERGFDGRAEDDYGWMTTPSAALSDLESAPEDWFDEATHDTDDRSASHHEAAMETPAADHATDSWFDEVESSATVEATEVTSGELWLPPDLSDIVAPVESMPEVAPVAGSEAEEGAVAGPAELDREPLTLAKASEVAPFEDSARVADAESDVEPVGLAQAPDTQPVAERFEEAHVEMESTTAASYAIETTWPAPDSAVRAASDAPPREEEVVAAAEFSAPALEPHESVEARLQVDGESFEAVAAQFESEEEATSPVEAFIGHEDPIASGVEPAFDSTSVQDAAAPSSMEIVEAEALHAVPAAEMHVPSLSDQVAEVAPPPANAVEQPALESSSHPPAPFITETLAELYLQQGFREEALAIYRQLAERNPSDHALRARIATLEHPVEAPQPTRDHADAHPADSQSVRSFFSRLARRHAAPQSNSADPAVPAPPASTEVPFAAAASALANLFSAAKPSPTDEGAANSLATAFTEPAGRPTRAAERELSLDHLFRDVASSGEAPAEDMTLDEFYAPPGAPSGSPTEPVDAASQEPGGTDIRQFTAWLEGLRKK